MSVTAQGTYLIKNEQSGLYLTVKGFDKNVPADIVQERLHDWPERASQAWRLLPGQAGKDSYRLQNQHSGRYLQIRHASKESGAHAEQAHLEENKPAFQSQTWQLSGNGDEVYLITNVHSGLKLNVRGNLNTEGTPIDQWQEHAAGQFRGYQLWRLEAVEPRGEAKALDALTGAVVEPTGGIISAITTGFKATLEATGGVFGTVSRWVPGIDRTPYVRFSGFRADEFIRFSQRNRVEVGPKKISEQFRHLPKEFRDGFDVVIAAPKRSGYDYIGVAQELYVEFSDRRSSAPLPWDRLFPAEIAGGRGISEVKAVATASPDGSRHLAFTTAGIEVIEGHLPIDPNRRPVVEPVTLDFLPEEFKQPDAVSSAVLGEETHFFATKGDQFTVFTWEKVVQGPTKVVAAYPFLLGLWM
ncbi:RICIN domain-containing protein [Streptomyces sp. MST-110588]|uniref:RICIN domain-containing protein n=1 Tax=Streptomyces sp. MST-110588 TaxID=2833628 RepID=UPI001F5CC562|nr:RICIN domain-containing protein [Streptomyces sp. MST-110588]UNO43496.1 RICIN domain-containing protein [Streptomyces sp. MST-110588]